MGAKITQLAHAVPTKIVTNNDLSQIMDTTDEWIRSRTGITQRHIATTETTASLCTQVAIQLLQQAALPATALDFIVVCTMSPDYFTPATAAVVQGAIGATNAFAYDLNAACSGFVYGLNAVQHYFQNDQPMHGLLIGGEVLSRLLNWQDRSTAVLFGDGAAGVLLENSSTAHFLASDLATFGDRGGQLTAGYQGSAPLMVNGINQMAPYFKMDGRGIYSFATRGVPASIERALEKADLTCAQVDHFILHQANTRIITQVAKRLRQPLAKFPQNMAAYGNTSAASIPILLDECVRAGQIKPGAVLALSGFGGGLTVGTQIIIY
ncbi:beta-ketoacyl-ACP synthase III [Loigolactobacillus zhaoyuanensis]|uniref:Beta-ketoacyl-[acyl-carrier-protein] synthase III n=1 Tax=Loigolactobacillus zhaoyuanensis TaxID=2486017 RepID=A0ABW8UE29_9LACO|nr:beta-ketoacyl-ACP synthase III [Loigolactobacillus zhaoyuanensis]